MNLELLKKTLYKLKYFLGVCHIFSLENHHGHKTTKDNYVDRK